MNYWNYKVKERRGDLCCLQVVNLAQQTVILTSEINICTTFYTWCCPSMSLTGYSSNVTNNKHDDESCDTKTYVRWYWPFPQNVMSWCFYYQNYSSPKHPNHSHSLSLSLSLSRSHPHTPTHTHTHPHTHTHTHTPTHTHTHTHTHLHLPLGELLTLNLDIVCSSVKVGAVVSLLSPTVSTSLANSADWAVSGWRRER